MLFSFEVDLVCLIVRIVIILVMVIMLEGFKVFVLGEAQELNILMKA